MGSEVGESPTSARPMRESYAAIRAPRVGHRSNAIQSVHLRPEAAGERVR